MQVHIFGCHCSSHRCATFTNGKVSAGENKILNLPGKHRLCGQGVELLLPVQKLKCVYIQNKLTKYHQNVCTLSPCHPMAWTVNYVYFKSAKQPHRTSLLLLILPFPMQTHFQLLQLHDLLNVPPSSRCPQLASAPLPVLLPLPLPPPGHRPPQVLPPTGCSPLPRQVSLGGHGMCSEQRGGHPVEQQL